MTITAQQKARQFISARHNHPAWRLLVSPRAPLMLGCLTVLFEQARDGVAEEDALQALTNMLLAFAEEAEFDVDPDKAPQQAGRELREWIHRGLIIERSHRLYSTDALNSAVQFIESLDNRIMTTTASRLAVVQQQIEQLETGLNPNPASRIRTLENKIAGLQKELGQARAGHIEVLTENDAIEALKEVYTLASGLSADFRRVEDSWREADRQLRQTIVSEGALIHESGSDAKTKLKQKLFEVYPQLDSVTTKSLRSGWKQLEVHEHFGDNKLTSTARHTNDGMLRMMAILLQLDIGEPFCCLMKSKMA